MAIKFSTPNIEAFLNDENPSKDVIVKAHCDREQYWFALSDESAEDWVKMKIKDLIRRLYPSHSITYDHVMMNYINIQIQNQMKNFNYEASNGHLEFHVYVTEELEKLKNRISVVTLRYEELSKCSTIEDFYNELTLSELHLLGW